MYCNKCGNKCIENAMYCNKCGNLLVAPPLVVLQPVVTSKSNEIFLKNKIIKNKYLLISIGIAVILIFFVVTVSSGQNVYISDSDDQNSENIESSSTTETKSKSKTSIVYDTIYEGEDISNDKDAIDLIVKDSNIQKKKCENKEITTIEDRITKNYGITAVNLCELSTDYALEIENVVKRIYNDYPKARGYLTNLTLTNAGMQNGYIAIFIGAMQFASSDTSSTYPWVLKTVIGMNSTYFLNTVKMESSVKSAANRGHFPKGTTRYSPVAHEFGHYLSFLTACSTHDIDKLLLLNENNVEDYYGLSRDWNYGTNTISIIDEAYKNYKAKYKDNKTILEFRESISKYAVAKDNDGEYIYDETIAEAFHDFYINGSNSAKASIEIVAVLKSRIDRLGD